MNLFKLLLIVFSVNCVSAELDMSYRISSASWYKLKANTGTEDEFVKYSGPMGTYTAKHIPIAVRGNDVDYFTFSKNHKKVLEIMVGDSNGNLVKITEKTDTIDPHDNAVINYWDGYIWVVVSGRSTVREAIAYRSKNRDDISEFIEIDRGEWTYPQLWQHVMIYSKYNNWRRELHAKNRFCDNKLVEGGHYAVSYDDGEWVHMAYNWHPEGKVDDRTGVYYMKSRDGCNWFDVNDNELTLPLSEFDTSTLLHETNRLYLKDLTVKDGEVNILAVESDLAFPYGGTRKLYRFTPTEKNFITDVGHNYNTGGFIDGYIVTPTFGKTGFAGGDLSIFDWYGNELNTGNYKYLYNYVRKIYKGSGAYVSEAPSSHLHEGAYIRRLDIQEAR